MPSEAKKPAIFLAFANERDDLVRYLRNLPEEARNIRQALDLAKRNGLCDVVERPNATLKDILDVFQDPEYHNRIAVFHYGGHANGYQLLLESAEGSAAPAYAGGLASFLGQQTGLQLVFLNGCATQKQVQGLVDAKVSLVIATSRAIDDRVATEFASRFYRGLAGGANIQRAYNEARAAIQTEHGDATRNLYVAERSAIDMAEDRLPWDLYLRPGAELAAGWNLPEAVGDPLFDLPPVPIGDLPPSPFRHLSWFAREHAEVFFGRGYEIRDLYHRVTDRNSAPIILFYGQSGVGKSSVLAAGLLPRLETDYDICYLRRDGKKGLLGTLEEELSIKEGKTIAESWLAQESKAAKPLIIILDQAEEAFTRPNPDLPRELDEFWDALQAIFSDPGHRPQGKLILGFRKEWLAEIEKQLLERKTPFSRLLLERLTRRGIIESVNGPAKSERLQQKYRLAVEDGLAEIIADDLLEDRESAIAPAMQILLTKMWEVARKEDCDKPFFDRILYQSLKKKGILLQDFLDQQLNKMDLEVVDSGLALDVLAFHTTPLGTAEERTEEVIQKTYQHQIPVVKHLIPQCVDLYLLEKLDKEKVATRLSHDTLAPLVRQRYATSDRPGQRARRVLESRSVDWQDEKQGAPLDEQDLELVEQGKDGMRAWEPAEERLVEASRKERDRKAKGRRIQRILGISAIILIMMLATYQMVQADSKEEITALYMSLQSTQIEPTSASDYIAKVLLAVESLHHKKTSEGDFVLRRSIALLLPSISTLNHDDRVDAVAFSPDGSKVLTGSDDGKAHIWDVSSGQEVRKLVHDGPVEAVAFSPDGTEVLTGSYDGKACIWKASSGEKLHEMSHSGSVWAVDFSPDGTKILTGSSDGNACIWDASSDKKLHELPHDGTVWSVAFSPDGSKVLTGSYDGKACIWGASSGKKLYELPHDDSVEAVAFSPDGSKVLTGSDDSTARIWDVSSGQEIERLVHSSSVNAVDFSPDGTKVLTGSYDTAHIWDVSTGQELHEMTHDGPVNSVVFSPNGTKVLTGSSDGKACIWAESIGQKVHKMPHGGKVWAVAFSPDNSKVLTGSSDNTSRIWDALSGHKLREVSHGSSVNAVDFSPDGTKVLTGSSDGKACIWKASSGEKLHEMSHGGSVLAVAFSPDETKILTGSDDTARIWDVSSGQEIQRLIHEGGVLAVDFSPNGKMVLTGGYDWKACVWDASSGKKLHEMTHDGNVFAATFSPDGTMVLTGADNGKACIWDASSGKKLHELTHKGRVLAATFSPNGTMVLTGADDGKACIWDASSAKMLHETTHDGPVWAVDFSSDGSKFLTGGEDGTAWIWPVSYEDLITQACDCMAENLTIEEWKRYKITNVRTCPKEGSFNQSAFERLQNDPWGFLTGKPECEPCIAEAFRNRADSN